MPPARPRADDSRSESSSVIANQKERTSLHNGITKSKKNGNGTPGDANSTLKTAAINGALAVIDAISNTVVEEPPQTDWNSMSIPSLHGYRSAYKISTPASYTQPHAELMYRSSDLAKRSPSQVLARRKLKDLKAHRRKMTQLNGTQTTKSSKSKSKDKDSITSDNSSRDGRRRQQQPSINGVTTNTLHPLTNGDTIAQSIEPKSPTLASASGRSDSAPSTLLNSSNPEATIIGRQSPTALATNIRKHFNAQPLHEHETIARFTYVMRQHGYGSAALSTTTTNGASGAQSTAVGATISSTPAATTTISAHMSTPIRVEGCDGDGTGWIMGSSGREVRISDSGGGGAFRLRFRP